MVQQKRSISPLALVLILSGVFFAIFLVISGMFFLTKSPVSAGRNSSSTTRLFSTGSVGIIEINGIILDSKKTLSRLERFEEDDQIKAVVLRMNSPGGAVAPSQEVYEAVKKFKKPLVVSIGSVAASGAYYIAVGAKKIFANPGSMTGSIGVIMEFANLKKLYEWAKVERYVIKTGKFKDVGSEYREMTDDERTLLQGMTGDILQQFKKAVATGRKLSMAQVTAVADGRIFSGAQAKEAHLVDELGTLQDAIDDAAQQAKIKGKPNVIYIDKKRKGLLEVLFEDSGTSDGAESSSSNAGQLLQAILKVTSLLERWDGGQMESDQGLPGAYFIWNGARLGR